jgi:hypothetical protein
VYYDDLYRAQEEPGHPLWSLSDLPPSFSLRFFLDTLVLFFLRLSCHSFPLTRSIAIRNRHVDCLRFRRPGERALSASSFRVLFGHALHAKGSVARSSLQIVHVIIEQEIASLRRLHF